MVEGLAEFIAKCHIKTRIVDHEEYLVMYKAVRPDFGSWYRRTLTSQSKDGGAYKPGTTVDCRTWSSNRRNECGKGLHVGTRAFVKRFIREICHYIQRMVLIEVLVRPEDVVCVPLVHKGKIRCKRLVVVKTVSRNKKPSEEEQYAGRS